MLEATEAAQKLGGPVWVVKAQIHAGGRGKGGGVKLARSIDDVNRLLPTVEPFLHEGKQGPILVVAAVEERADVRLRTETPARQRGRRLLAVHVIA